MLMTSNLKYKLAQYALWHHIRTIIQNSIDIAQLTAEEAHQLASALDANELADAIGVLKPKAHVNQFGQIILGAPQKPQAMQEVTNTYKNNPNYESFEKLLKAFLNININAQVGPIKEYRFIKVTYRSSVTWKSTTDYLRCSPSFFHQPRYDFILFESTVGPLFAKLLFVFTLQEKQDIALPLALILPYDGKITSAKRNRDQNLGLYRVRHQSRPQIIHLGSIIRGAVVFPSFDDDYDGFVFDVVDTDMFTRVKGFWSTL
ncbi:hypothetical protein EST38_g8708 [Candolleomyces aberdarensis]|uniref:Uncharacterized protein n=1 Tax=Candolleomyces aberdarensis TaxID=2316362 RepID=A0A4Q2DBU1_9AGAR|nr:hypothetical protein EST38_g8708 [Candolleomyces aberdarensis]